MDIAKRIPSINKHIDLDKPHVNPDEKSHLGLCVPQIIFDYGGLPSKIKSLPNIVRYLSRSIIELNKSYNHLYDQPKNALKKISDEDLKQLNTYCKTLGILDIGFAKVNPSYIFSDKKILFENAIVVTMEMNKASIKTAPSKESEKEILRTYYQLNVAVNKIKKFLNDRGYKAQAGPALGGEVSYPLLAQAAGLGEIGKHGLLITNKCGPSLRIAAVYTDIENLPIHENINKPWIKDFCDSCNRCVNKCPASAIYKETKIFYNKTQQHIDYKKCAIPFSKNKGCSICIKECAFFIGNYDKIKQQYFKNIAK